MVTTLREKFADLELCYSIGGQISFDVFPQVLLPWTSLARKDQARCNSKHLTSASSRSHHVQGWDKTYCLQFLEEFDEIHFFGDKTFVVSACTLL